MNNKPQRTFKEVCQLTEFGFILDAAKERDEDCCLNP